MGFNLTVDQRAAVENRGGPLLVSAAAGAGKTRVLVERLMARVMEGANVDQFLIITFTNAAAAELRGRIGEELAEKLAEFPENRHLRRQTALVYQAHISTIHAFCQDFLRQWGHLAEVDSDFRLVDEGEGEVLRREAVERLLEEEYAHPAATLGLLLDTFSLGRDDWGLTNMVLDIYDKLQSHPDPNGWISAQKSAFSVETFTDAAQTVWGEYLLQGYRRTARYWAGEFEKLLEDCREWVPMYVDSLAVTLADLQALGSAATWEEAKAPEFPRLGSTAKCEDKELAGRVKDIREVCKKRFQKIGEKLGTPSGEILRDLGDVAPAAQGLLDLVGRFSAVFQDLKKSRNVLDFNDLEHITLKILRENPDVRREWESRFIEVMVDEYQDTNQVQNAIFDALTAQNGNLFMVGDVKQSIYRFRLADPGIFLEKYRAFPDYPKAEPRQGRRVILGENFRSRSEIIDCVNFLFENLMSRELGELDYGEAERLKTGGEFPARSDCQTEFHLISNPKADIDGDNSMTEPRFVANRLRELLDSGFPVSDGQGGQRPVQPSDMAILLRAPGRVLNRYIRALGEVGLPWASEGGEDFYDAPEVAVARSYLEIIDNPRQDVPLIAVLRSPIYGFSPDKLAALGAAKGEGCFYDALVSDEAPDSRGVVEELTGLRLVAQDMRSYELLWEIYCRTGLLAKYAALPDGESRREHLLALYNCARRFETGGHKGLFGFLTHLRRSREQGEELTSPAGSAGVGVRILSIHRAKGLEYPVVVAAGLGKGFNRQDSQAPMLFHRELGLGPQGLDQDRRIQYPTIARWAVGAKLQEEMLGEELRLLYVALTRAREKLIMTAAMKEPEREISKLADWAALPAPPEILATEPTAAHWILTAALCRREGASLRDNKPLRWAPPAGTRWGADWVMTLQDGTALDRPQRVSGRVTEGAEPTENPDFPDYTWVYPRLAAADIPSKLTATQLKGRTLDEEVAEEGKSPQKPVLFDRPNFAQEKGLTAGERGTAHHMVMQFLDFSKAVSPEGVKEEIRRMVAKEIITPQQGEAVDPEVIWRFFQSDIGKELAGAELHREFKFSVLRPAEEYYPQAPKGETVLLQGVVDCWWDTPEGLVILDFKSDRVTADSMAARAEGYRPQLEAYAGALGQVLNRPVAKKVLWFFAVSQSVIL